MKICTKFKKQSLFFFFVLKDKFLKFHESSNKCFKYKYINHSLTDKYYFITDYLIFIED